MLLIGRLLAAGRRGTDGVEVAATAECSVAVADWSLGAAAAAAAGEVCMSHAAVAQVRRRAGGNGTATAVDAV